MVEVTPAPGGEAFFFPGGKVGALLVHGFTGTPGEMRWLGEYLASRGVTVSGLRLPGHGTSPEDLARRSWREWVDAVQGEWYRVMERCSVGVVVGLSMGGVLALHLAAHNPDVAGVVAMSTPSVHLLPRMRLYFLQRLNPLGRFRKRRKVALNEPDAVARHLAYDRVPYAAGRQLAELLRHVDGDLPEVRSPVLFIHSLRDETVPADHTKYLAGRVRAPINRVVWLERSAHVVTEDVERDRVFTEVYGFLRERSL